MCASISEKLTFSKYEIFPQEWTDSVTSSLLTIEPETAKYQLTTEVR